MAVFPRFTRCAAALLACAAGAALAQSPASPTVPKALETGVSDPPAFVLHAKGVQVYDCKAAPNSDKFAWVLREPVADLSDSRGAHVGRHYAGPTWEAEDGSKAVGTIRARADAPDGKSIAWLLATARSSGAGMFDKVNLVQRINTVGGSAPAACVASEAGKETRVDYTADYVFYKAK